ncbi:hypothetical protein IscW_ISCW003984 [Ixodes scapularis]|uniref:Uncharacterized protein n=1 Tax=Ixodes scapularis TaxID=6945 RepID=B7PJ62_IXOSC|nr:hypothetical protein IscW_ISCW003984 [Ixodes scapularis]|eukprot:XP_002407210.1 hypothetical protein IscW_ISCW003984 [Ixodes scapularis]
MSDSERDVSPRSRRRAVGSCAPPERRSVPFFPWGAAGGDKDRDHLDVPGGPEATPVLRLGGPLGGATSAPSGSRFCRGCGSLFVHRAHLQSLSHVERLTEAGLRGANALALVLVQMERDPPFAAAIMARAPRL